MTTTNDELNNCPAEQLLKNLAGKWKPQIFQLALNGPLRFNALLRALEGSNKQSLSTALRELQEAEILHKKIIKDKPLHIEYSLTEKARLLIPVFQQLETITKEWQ